MVDLHNYHDFYIIDRTGRTIGAMNSQSIGTFALANETDFMRRIFGGETVVSKPFVRSADDDSANRLSMVVGSPVFSGAGDIVAMLAFDIQPEKDFFPIFVSSRPGQSGKTYVIDQRGRMLSPSRFEEKLRQIGLLSRLDSESILNFEVRDPGGDLTRGFSPTANRSALPLTKAAASAAAEESGFDISGYRDFRGVDVVGAWQWLPQHDMGVIIEIDTAEAFKTLYFLCKLFTALFSILMITALACIFSSRFVSTLRKRVHEASKLGQYKLDQKIGEGGMGEVYLASHSMLQRPTAIKLLKPDCASEECITRFEREVQNTSKLQHPNTIAIYDFGRTPDDQFYYAMEYLTGISLSELVRREGPIPEARVAYILRQVCESLAEAHAAELIHRDIKPANIMLCKLGLKYDFVKVLDFGLVKSFAEDSDDKELTQVDVVTGTPGFMAPELAREGGIVDHRVDIYALGCVGYWLLTGQHVFPQTNTVAILVDHVKTTPIAPSQRSELSVSPDMDKLILSCLEKDPARRPQTAEEVIELLYACHLQGQWAEKDAKNWWTLHSPLDEIYTNSVVQAQPEAKAV